MNAPLPDEEQFVKGARVRRRYFVQPTFKAAAEHDAPSDSARGQAYVLAMANPHKSWAKRWLRERKYL